jgi:hypothetical protein
MSQTLAGHAALRRRVDAFCALSEFCVDRSLPAMLDCRRFQRRAVDRSEK